MLPLRACYDHMLCDCLHGTLVVIESHSRSSVALHGIQLSRSNLHVTAIGVMYNVK